METYGDHWLIFLGVTTAYLLLLAMTDHIMTSWLIWKSGRKFWNSGFFDILSLFALLAAVIGVPVLTMVGLYHLGHVYEDAVIFQWMKSVSIISIALFAIFAAYRIQDEFTMLCNTMH